MTRAPLRLVAAIAGGAVVLGGGASALPVTAAVDPSTAVHTPADLPRGRGLELRVAKR